VLAGWAALGLLVAAFGGALTLASAEFGYAHDVAQMPVAPLAAGLVAAGLVFCFVLPPLIRLSAAADTESVRLLTMGIVVAGLAARLTLLASEPILEDDYQRYLWDGAVTASGENPYAISPQDARRRGDGTTLGRLAAEAGPVVRRINHPEIRTIYPPVAQAAFALAHSIRPFRLSSWRSLLLLCDLATLALILALLGETGRSPLWSALYWWNPLVIKELFNSAHMDAVVLPFVLLAVLLAARGRRIASVASLAFAAGAKVWPVLLLPLVLRPLIAQPFKLACALLIFGALGVLLAAPIVLGGLDASSGLAAYFAAWQTNSALFPALKQAAIAFLGPLGLPEAAAGASVRAAIGLTLAGLAIGLSLEPLRSADDLVGRASVLVAGLVLLSPAQFPWYVVWFAPFLAFRPWAGFLVLTATAPLYYMSFYFTAAGEPEVFTRYVVWIIWVPVWAALILEAARRRLAAPAR
jgi:hypothetical protein